MSSTTAVAMAMPITTSRAQTKPTSDAFFHPLRVAPRPAGVRLSTKRAEVIASGSMKEKAISGLTAAALVAALVMPDIAEAAQPGMSPSLKNFILSIVSGGGVLVAIIGAVVGVSNFDPVKRS